jgi:SAM-dependent methyltransferase
MSSEESNLECTGERVIEAEYQATASRYLIYLFHIATYDFCRPYLAEKNVLEFGSGSGYGTHSLSNDCKRIVGVDISADAIEFSKQQYQNENLSYQKIEDIESTPLPFADNEFDVVISFQVMEHIRQVDTYLAEIQRVLRDGGTLIIATPDRTARLYAGQRPWNVYHVIEYSSASFRIAVAHRFPHTEMYAMSGNKEVLDIELRRTKKLRLLTYPFTFPYAPEWYRQFTLRMMKKFSSLMTRFSQTKSEPSTDVASYNFSLEDISISKDAEQSVNIISVSRNSK